MVVGWDGDGWYWWGGVFVLLEGELGERERVFLSFPLPLFPYFVFLDFMVGLLLALRCKVLSDFRNWVSGLKQKVRDGYSGTEAE